MRRWQISSNNGGWFRPATIYVSTVELPKLYDTYSFETCVFAPVFNPVTEVYDWNRSEVVDHYDTLAEAIIGHTRICRQYNINA